MHHRCYVVPGVVGVATLAASGWGEAAVLGSTAPLMLQHARWKTSQLWLAEAIVPRVTAGVVPGRIWLRHLPWRRLYVQQTSLRRACVAHGRKRVPAWWLPHPQLQL